MLGLLTDSALKRDSGSLSVPLLGTLSEYSSARRKTASSQEADQPCYQSTPQQCSERLHGDVQEVTQKTTGVPCHQHALVFGKKSLDGTSSVAECVSEENGTGHVPVHLRGGMQLFVQTPRDRTITLSVEPSDVVATVMAKIQDKEGDLNGQERLVFSGKYLENKLTLADYDVRRDSTLFLVQEVKGGLVPISFKFNSFNEEVKLEFDSSVPSWRVASHGISFKSTCLNAACSAFNDTIYINKGFGDFDIAEVSCELTCPQCGQTASESMNCGFYMANWEFRGMLQNKEKRMKQGTADTHHYYTFKEGDNASWRYLKIKVTKLPESS